MQLSIHPSPTGGIGVDLTHQTATHQNLLIMAKIKIWSRNHECTTGQGAGMKLLEIPVNPLSEQCVNKCAYIWAKQHTRFDGSLTFHIYVVII